MPAGMQPRGFTLVEVLVSLSVLCVAGVGGMQLLAVSLELGTSARLSTTTAMLASARMEQLRALAFESDANGVRQTDTTTDLSVDPPGVGGGGLRGSASDSLVANTSGFVDYLDAHGRWIGNGPAPPPGSVFVRRWSIEPSAPATDLVVVQVLVRPLGRGTATAAARRTRGETRLVTVMARVGR